jgi:hypothetical protein
MIRPLLVAPLLGLLWMAPQADELQWHVAKGTTLVRQFECDSAGTLDSMEVTLNGEPQIAGDLPEFLLTQNFHAEFSDTIEALESARAQRFVRKVSAIQGERRLQVTPPGQAQQEDVFEITSELSGKSVRFEAAKDGWSKAFVGDEKGAEELLESLSAELDFQAFLPGKAVSEGDTWELEPAAFLNFMRPGGLLSLQSKLEDAAANNVREAQFDASIEGEADATYKGTREQGGVKLCVIAIRAEIKIHATYETGTPESQGTVSSASTNSYELKGEILWGPSAGFARAANLAGALKVEQVHERSLKTDDETMNVVQRLNFSGQANYKVAVESQP